MSGDRFGVALLGVACTVAAAPEARTIEVFKSPTCWCCDSDIAFLRKNGFNVSVTNVSDASGVKAELGVP